MVALMQKAKNAGISLYPEEIDELRELASLRDGGSPSRYVRRHLKADLNHDPVPTSYDPDILAKMATTYAGYLAPKLAAALAEEDQPKVLHQLLTQVQECYACGATSADVVTVPRWALDKNHPWYQPAPEPAAEDLPMAAEDQAPYNKCSPADQFSVAAAALGKAKGKKSPPAPKSASPAASK